jgi:hypothetical protein
MKKILATALLALTSLAAQADDFTVQLVQSKTNPLQYTASFGRSFSDASIEPFFDDYYTFTPDLSGQLTVNGGVFNVHTTKAQNIIFKEADLSGTDLLISNGGFASSAVLSSSVVDGTLVLHVFGQYGAASSYAGNLNVTLAPVPEPETYAMLLGGLGLVGAVARRRKAAKAA